MDNKINLSAIKGNPSNPRIIKDDKFKKLVTSLTSFPEMMEKRPMVCVTDVDGMIFPLGGNMRLKALKEIGHKDIPTSWIMMADDWTEEKRKEFTIKDNVGFGEWDFDALDVDWNTEQLNEWGMEIWESEDVNLDEFFEESTEEEKEPVNKITLEYSDADFELITEAFEKHSGSKEEIIFNLVTK